MGGKTSGGAEEDGLAGEVAQDAVASGSALVVQGGGDVTVTVHQVAVVRPDAPVGVPLEQVEDPFSLEVHRPIKLDGTHEPDGSPALPWYVRRDHDELLGEVVERAVEGHSAMAVLVAGSSAGKTRACWEALAPLRAAGGWRLWHPYDPTRLEAALAGLDRVGPRTVVWLNETQEYLGASGDRDERVAAKLRTLLADTSRAPVLVLGTLWPDHHDALTRHSGSQVRQVLEGRVVRVPDTFTGADLTALRRGAGSDSRLAWAVEHAEGGRITQYLAGAPELLERFHTAPRAAEASMVAAIDARRLGHRNALPQPLLEQAAQDYLTDAEWGQSGEDWLGPALEYATRPCKGAPGPLTRIRSGHDRPGRGRRTTPTADGPPRYRLHDYLYQHAERSRTLERCPAGLWNALADHTTDVDDLTRLAHQAQQRGLYGPAARMAGRAAALDSVEAMRLLAWLHDLQTRTAESDEWQARADALEPPPPRFPVLTLDDLQEPESDLRERAETGDRGAMKVLADRLMSRDAEEAVFWARRAAVDEDPASMMLLAETLRYAGLEDEAKQVLISRAEAGDAGAMWILDQVLSRLGETEEAFHWARAHAETGSPLGVSRLSVLLRDRGEHAAAESLLRRHAEAGSPSAMWYLGHLLVDAGHVDEAVTWFQRSAADDLLAVNLIVKTCRELDRLADAEPPLRAQHDKGQTSATEKLAELLVLLDRPDEAELLLRWLVEVDVSPVLLDIDEPSAMRELVDLLRRTGRGAEADRLRRYGMEPGGATAQAFRPPTAP